eukprot:symbB.v1.2.034368.t1/scaffold4423.1/size39831/4
MGPTITMTAENLLAEGCWKLRPVAVRCEVKLHLPVFFDLDLLVEHVYRDVLNQNLHSRRIKPALFLAFPDTQNLLLVVLLLQRSHVGDEPTISWTNKLLR